MQTFTDVQILRRDRYHDTILRGDDWGCLGMCGHCVNIAWGRLDPFDGDGKIDPKDGSKFCAGASPRIPYIPIQYYKLRGDAWSGYAWSMGQGCK